MRRLLLALLCALPALALGQTVTPSIGPVGPTGPAGPPTVAVTLAAAGTTQGTAAIPSGAGSFVVTPVAAGAGVILIASATIEYVNAGNTPLTVYPPLGGTIGSNAANAPVLIGVGGVATFHCQGVACI